MNREERLARRLLAARPRARGVALWSGGAALLAACGGVGAGEVMTQAAQRIASVVPAASGSNPMAAPPNAAANAPAQDLNALFDWAEATYPQLFPGHRANQSADAYTFRYYPETDNYLGVSGSGIWILGPLTGSAAGPKYVAEVSDFRCAAFPTRCDDSITLRWVLSPTEAVVPGLVVDPDPTTVQDQGLNSSAVVRLERSGLPVAGERVAWSFSDPTGQAQTLSSVSDESGNVRAWYFAGSQAQQSLSVRHVWSGKSTTVQMQRATVLKPTVARYVATYFTAPKGSYSAAAVTVIPRTTPDRTYYELATVWTVDGQLAFYGGLQKTPCSDGVSTSSTDPCRSSRGKYRGSQALFSTWDWRTSTGELRAAVLVSNPGTTTCKQHGETGGGLQCIAPLDWAADETWTWTVTAVSGAPVGYTRIRVAASNAERGLEQELAVVDVAPALNLGQVSAFNENWGGAPAATCLDVALRRMTIVSVGFRSDGKWASPQSGRAMGGLYSGGGLACENYSLRTSTSGLDITSGGTGTWVTLADALIKDTASGQLKFADQAQTVWQWQPLDLSTLVPMK